VHAGRAIEIGTRLSRWCLRWTGEAGFDPSGRGEAEWEGSLGDKRVEEREMCQAFRSFYPPKRTQQDTKPL